jgi:hypothetical protein
MDVDYEGRGLAARCAIVDLCSAVNEAALAGPPFLPPIFPFATAFSFFPVILSSSSPVAIRITFAAFPMTSARRFSPLGPVGTKCLLWSCQLGDNIFYLSGNSNRVVLVEKDHARIFACFSLANFAHQAWIYRHCCVGSFNSKFAKGVDHRSFSANYATSNTTAQGDARARVNPL